MKKNKVDLFEVVNLLIKDLGLIGSRLALIIPGAVSTFNLMIMITGFEGIPQSLEESTRIDGADRCRGCGIDHQICNDHCIHGADSVYLSLYPEALCEGRDDRGGERVRRIDQSERRIGVMLRMFATHRIRKQTELSACLWDFSTMPGDGEEAVRLKALVPGCWETYPGLRSYRGEACYERSFEAGGNIRLEFKGVSHTAQVYLDGEEITSHYNAYTPFSAVVKNVPAGEHRLKVCVDNSFGEHSALHVPNDYQTYGGITRAVALEEIGEAYVKWIHITPDKAADGWKAQVEICVRNLSQEVFAGRLRLVLGEDGKITGSLPVTLSPDETAVVRTELICGDVRQWCPENPALYTLAGILEDEAGQEIDDLMERFGFRKVEVRGKDILLNGSKLRIRGFCRHEDHPQFGCSLPLEAIWQDILIMKDLGANSVRTSHYPNEELFLDLCDEQGILVWEENHARGLAEEAMRNPNFERQCEDCIREMIEAHYNHPSIYIWGILNECASHTEYGKSCYEAQLSLIRELDQSRPRSFASCQFKTDICFGLVDVVSYNIYPLWYHDTPVEEYLADLYRWVQECTQGAGKPFLVTEIGAGAVYGYRTPDQVKWSEEYQRWALDRQLKAVLSHEDTSGVYIWQFCDCRVCDSWFGGRPRTMNNKGIVDEYRRPKLAYETVKRIFEEDGR